MSLPVPLPSSKDTDQQLPRTTLLAHFEAFHTTDLPECLGTRPAAGAPHRAVPGRGRGVPSPGELYPPPRHGAWLCRAAGGDKHTAQSHGEQSHVPQERTQALPGVICWHHAAAHIQGSPKIFRPACFSFLKKRLTWLKGAAVKLLAQADNGDDFCGPAGQTHSPVLAAGRGSVAARGAHLYWAPAGDPAEHTVLMEQAGRTQNSPLVPPLPLGSGGAELKGRGSKAARPRGAPQAPRGCGRPGRTARGRAAGLWQGPPGSPRPGTPPAPPATRWSSSTAQHSPGCSAVGEKGSAGWARTHACAHTRTHTRTVTHTHTHTHSLR